MLITRNIRVTLVAFIAIVCLSLASRSTLTPNDYGTALHSDQPALAAGHQPAVGGS